MLKLIKMELLARGITENPILAFNFKDITLRDLRDFNLFPIIAQSTLSQ